MLQNSDRSSAGEMVTEEPRTQNPTISQRSPGPNNNGGDNIFSPRFKSVAAMAGWDEETLLMASLIVDDTPDRQNKIRKRPNFKTPPSNSRRKRREQATKNPPIKATILNLDDDEEEDTARNRGVSSSAISKPDLPDNEREKKVETQNGKEESEMATSPNGSINSAAEEAGVAASIPCMDKLREELSCAICLDICFEPSTTPCGHSFCKKCLRSAADKCGKRCPKCRQLIGNGRSCTVNTVLWNTIQLLFPKEIEARKASSSSAEKKSDRDRVTDISNRQDPQTRRPQPTAIARRNSDLGRSSTRSSSRRQAVPSQDVDAALALRLQREEFLQVVRVGRGSSSNRDNSTISISVARDNLRAMASRAINVRIRNRAT